MNKDLNNLLVIDQEIGDFLLENQDLSNNELDNSNSINEKHFVNKALKILNKLSSKNVIELIKRSRYLNDFIDIKKFIKKYPLNKAYLKKNNDMYIEEYRKLRSFCVYCSEIALNYSEFCEYMDVLDTDNVEAYLLENMPNNQIYELSRDTNDWNQKLYYFSFLKKS